MALKALIFDVDGTLADTERDGHRVAFNLAFAGAHLDWCWNEVLYGELLGITGGKERIKYYIGRYCPEIQSRADFESWVKQLHAAKTKHFVALLRAGKISLRPGVMRLLTEAHQAGMKLAIATTTTPDNVLALLQSAAPQLVSWFDVIGAGDVVPAKKPAADIYAYVLDQLQLSACQCVAFEDSENGVRASRGAGIKTIVTVNGYTQGQDFSGAAIVLNHMGEPDKHFQVLAGPPVNGKCCLDLALVQQLYEQDP